MFRKRIKKEFPPGTFIPTPLRVFAVLQLCLAFTVFLWHGSAPFMGDLFAIRSKMVLSQAVLDNRSFQQLPEQEQTLFLTDYKKLQGELQKPFLEKMQCSMKRIFLEIPPFEMAWIFFSVLISILLLLKVEGAVQAVWLLPVLAGAYAVDNRLGSFPHVREELKLFPSEDFIVKNYLNEPLSKNIFNQQKQLQTAWELYLIDQWLHEQPSDNEEIFQHQIEQGTFVFNVERLKRVIQEKRGFPPERESLFVLALYLFWNLSYALVASKIKRVFVTLV